jgi:hypothetical protein
MVLDLAGGILAAVGRDKNGRSIVAQTDGYILLQVGGKNASDPRFNNDNGIDAPGRFEIHFNRPGSPIGPSKIIVDEYGITISSAGRMLFESQGQMILSSKSDLLLNAKNIKQFGSYDATDRSITGAETLITRKGRMT